MENQKQLAVNFFNQLINMDVTEDMIKKVADELSDGVIFTALIYARCHEDDEKNIGEYIMNVFSGGNNEEDPHNDENWLIPTSRIFKGSDKFHEALGDEDAANFLKNKSTEECVDWAFENLN